MGTPGAIDTTLSFSADAAAAAEGTFTLADGSTISATAADGTSFTLVVPPQAVAEDTLIRLTPLANVQGLGAGPVHAVQLDPEGLELFEYARLTITPSTPIPVENQVMVEATGDGTEAQLALIDPASEPIVLLLEHFSIGLAASVSSEQRATFLAKSATNAERRINGQVRDRIQAERMSQLLGTSETDETPDVSDLTDEYKREVVDKLRQAAELGCNQLKSYVKKAIGFERQLQLLGGLTEAEEAASLGRAFEAAEFATSRFEACEKEAIAECTAAKDPSILIRFWLANERPADQARAEQLCEQGFALDFTGSDFSLRTPSIGTNATVDVSGRAEGCPSQTGEWAFGGEITLTYSNLPPAAGELVEPAGAGAQSPETFALEFPNAGSAVAFTDALGQPIGEFTLVNGLGETVGPFQLDIVRTDLPCSEPAP